MPSYAQTYDAAVRKFDASKARSFGFTPNVPGVFVETKDMNLQYRKETTEPDTLDEISSLAMGCSTVDIGDLMHSSLEAGLPDWKEYTDTGGFRDMASQIFTSPQLATIYNALENYAYHRAKSVQDRCAALQVQDDNAQLVWQSVQKCVQNKAADVTKKEDLSKAYLECLNDPLDGGLRDAYKEVVQSSKWSGTLYHALSNTDFCPYTSNQTFAEACSLLSFLPNVRWCARGKLRFDGAGSKRPYCEGESASEGLFTPEIISPQEIFDIAFTVADYVTAYGYAMAHAFLDGDSKASISSEDFKRLIRKTENKVGGENSGFANASGMRYDPKTEPSLEAFKFDINAGVATNMEGLNENIQFFKYAGCSSYGRGPQFYYDILQIADVVGDDENLSVVERNDIRANLKSAMPSLSVTVGSGAVSGTVYVSGGRYTKTLMSLSKGHFYDTGIVQKEYSQSDESFSTPQTLVDTKNALSLIGAAVACSSVHDLRLSLSDFVDIYAKGDGAGAAMLAYRTQLAYTATNRIMDFVRYRLQVARMQMSFSPMSDQFGFAPHMRRSVDQLIDAFGSRIQAMNDKRSIQKEFVRDFSPNLQN